MATELTSKEIAVRKALTFLRGKGLRNFEKYPPESWEPPLTEAEKKRLKPGGVGKREKLQETK